MPAYERIQVIEHEIGPRGELAIRSIAGSVNIRGVDGDTARIRAVYSVVAADEAEADRVVDVAGVRVERSPGRLEVAVREDRQGAMDAIARFLRGVRISADLDVQVPAGAVLRVETVSGDVHGTGTDGEQHVRTVSGDVELDEVAGVVALDGISGDLTMRASGRTALRASSVSGELRVRVPELASLDASTLSGDVDIEAGLDPAGEHRLETVSGDVRLHPAGGVTIRVRGVSGRIRCEPEHRLEGTAGSHVLTVGDGRAVLSFSTMSGDLAVTSRSAAVTGRADVATDRVRPRPDGAAPGGASGTPDVPGEAASAGDDLSILRALEHGEIDVEEASRRLALARRDSGA